MKAFALVLILTAVLSIATPSKRCSLHEVEIFYPKTVVNGTEKYRCLICPDCPLGQGLSPVQCGARVSNSTPIECRKCVEGETYSDVHGPLMCKPCHPCDNKVVLQECTLESNRRCSEKQCKKGFYYKWITATCERCSPCCVGEQYTSYNVHTDECRDMPEGQNCELTRKTRICPHRLATTTPQPNWPGTTTVGGPTTLTPTQERDPKPFLATATPTLQSTPSQSSKRSNITKPSQGSSKAIVISLAVGFVLIVICFLLFCAWKRKTNTKNTNTPSNSSSTTSLSDENEKFVEMQPLSKTQSRLVDGPERKPVLSIQDFETMLRRIPDAHLLKDLPAELFDEVEKDLNKQSPGVNGWRQVGIGMKVSERSLLDEFEMENRRDGSPAKRLIDYINARSPEELTKTFVEVLHEKERNDIVKKICDWDWHKENRRHSFLESSEQPLLIGMDH